MYLSGVEEGNVELEQFGKAREEERLVQGLNATKTKSEQRGQRYCFKNIYYHDKPFILRRS